MCVCVSVVFVEKKTQAGSLSPNPNWGPTGTRTHRIMTLSIGPKGRKRQGDFDPPGAQLGKFFINDWKAAGGWSCGCCLGQSRAKPRPCEGLQMGLGRLPRRIPAWGGHRHAVPQHTSQSVCLSNDSHNPRRSCQGRAKMPHSQLGEKERNFN